MKRRTCDCLVVSALPRTSVRDPIELTMKGTLAAHPRQVLCPGPGRSPLPPTSHLQVWIELAIGVFHRGFLGTFQRLFGGHTRYSSSPVCLLDLTEGSSVLTGAIANELRLEHPELLASEGQGEMVLQRVGGRLVPCLKHAHVWVGLGPSGIEVPVLFPLNAGGWYSETIPVAATIGIEGVLDQLVLFFAPTHLYAMVRRD
jgi:hypothetical protein